MNLSQLRGEVDKIKKRDDKLNFRSQRTEEYLQSYEFKKGKELFDELVKLEVPRLREQHIHKLIDILPRTIKETKVVLQGYPITISQDSMKKIAIVVAKYV